MWLFILIPIALILCAIPVVWSLQYRRVRPNEVLIVSGRPGTYFDPVTDERIDKAFTVIQGGGTMVVPLKERIDVMSVALMTLKIQTPEFHTRLGVPIVVDAIAQIKVRSDSALSVATAAEMFLGKSKDEMNEIAHQMMQGHLRAVISSLTFEEIHANPEMFTNSVQRLTAADLSNMGIEVVSFTIREVTDPSGYLGALSRPQQAEAKKRAVLGEAEAERDAAMGQAKAVQEASTTAAGARRLAKEAEIAALLAISKAEAERDQQVHQLSTAVAKAKAESDLAYELQRQKTEQQVARERLILSKLAAETVAADLLGTVDRPTEAECRRVEALASARANGMRSEAAAEADAVAMKGRAEIELERARAEVEAEGDRLKGLAEAEGVRAKLLAEAEGMRKKADAWKEYSPAALQEQMIAQLPKVAKAIASPLAKIERIVLMNTGSGDGATGVSQITKSVTDVMAQLPAVIEATTGVDIRQTIQRLSGHPDVTDTDSIPGA